MKLLYQFSAGDSFLHRLDPRTKLVFVVCFLISTFLLPHPWVMPLVIIAIIWILGRVSPLEYFVFILFLLPLMTAIVLIHLLTDGPPYFDARLLGVIPISTPGWDAGLLVAFRLAAMGIAFIMFSMTTDPFDWGMAMYQSGLNYKVAFMFAFAMRFFPLLQEELVVIRNALSARGYRAIGSRDSARRARVRRKPPRADLRGRLAEQPHDQGIGPGLRGRRDQVIRERQPLAPRR